ncbi:mRNA 3'-end-processing protein rna14, partial [Elasticomyces elasticus]
MASTPLNALISPSSQVPTLVQQTPKFRGGFEVDDDGDDQQAGADDAPEDDVYAPATNGAVASAGHEFLDRTPQTPTQANGTTHAPAQNFDSPAIAPSSIASNLPAQAFASSLSAQPKSRLSHDVIGILEDRVKDDPRGDIDAWLELIQEYKNRHKEDDTRKTYERYLAIFPLAADQWAAWLRWEEQHDRKVWMERILARCLTSVPDVDLINIYINY